MSKPTKRIVSLTLCLAMMAMLYIPAAAAEEEIYDHVEIGCCEEGFDYMTLPPFTVYEPFDVEEEITASLICLHLYTDIEKKGIHKRLYDTHFVPIPGGSAVVPFAECKIWSCYQIYWVTCSDPKCTFFSIAEEYIGREHSLTMPH